MWATAVYIYETGGLYIIEAAFPELDTVSVKVEVEGGDLVVRRKPAWSESGKNRDPSGDEIRRIPLLPLAGEVSRVVQFDHGVLRAAVKVRNPTAGL